MKESPESAELERDDTCDRFEALLAARADGALSPGAQRVLDEHLARCEACRVVADTLAPSADAQGDHAALPEVDPTSYELGLEVARGGMGRILAARDLRVGRPVAVKELLGRSSGLAARFEREARVTARLQHPGIVPIYEIGRWPDGTPFYSMRMVDGRTLRDAIDKAPDLVARIALLPAVIAAAEAVAFAHGRRIIHRDLTPSNILVGAYGETVVIDWGLAKDLTSRDEVATESTSADGGGPPGLTSFGAVIGTAAYMPPEQADARTVDERADVYALGAILYHVLAGQSPYRARDSENVIDAVKAGPPEPVETFTRRAPRDLVSIVAKAMARNPDERYPSARELVEELRRFHTGRMVEAHAYTRSERVRRFVGRHRAPVIVTATAMLLFATFGALSLRRVLVASDHARHTARTLLEERGRTEMLAGHPSKALAYLAAAYDQNARSPALSFLLAAALREVEDVEATLDCGGDVRFSVISYDGQLLAAACGDVGRIWRLSDYQPVRTFEAKRGFDTVIFSHDNKTLASIGRDGFARLYDVTTGELHPPLEHHAGVPLKRVMFTRDDRYLVTTGNDGNAVVWDAVTGTRLRTISAGTLGFLSVYGVMSPDGTTLITVTAGGTGTGWNIHTGEEIGSLGHGAQILGGALSPDGTLAATCGADRRAKVWNVARQALLWSIPAHSDVVWKCVFSDDSKRLLTASNDGTAKIWDLTREGALLTSVDAGDTVWYGELSHDGALLVTVSVHGYTRVWDASTGALLSSHLFSGQAAHFTSDGKRLVMERDDGKLQIWNRPGGAQRFKLVPPEGAEVIDVSQDGARAVLLREGRVELWNAETRRPLEHEALSEPIALSSDGRRLAAHASDAIVVVDTGDGHTVARLPVAGARELMLDGTGDVLVVSRDTEPPAVWDVTRQTRRSQLTGADHAAVSDDGGVVLGWEDAKPPTVWHADGSARALVGIQQPIVLVGFSHDGERVAITTDAEPNGRVVGVWNTRDGTKVFERRVSGDAARIDPGGTMLTVIDIDHTVDTVRLRDGGTVASFDGDRLAHAQVNASGTLAVGSDRLEATVFVVDAVDGRTVAKWPVLHSGFATPNDSFMASRGSASWTNDGAAIVTRSGDLTVWDAMSLPPDAAARVARAQREVPWRVVDGRLQ